MIRRWKQAVERNGGKFYVVLLPQHIPAASPRVPAILQEEAIATINLYDCFGAHDAEHYQHTWNDSPYRFKLKSNPHWNEAGNRLAALCLYRVLEADMRLPALAEATLQATLHRYYAAFGRGLPMNAGEDGKGSTRPPLAPSTAGIREKYQALTPLINQSPAFSVSLSGRFLTYHKEWSRPADLSAPFFVHVFPVDETDLPEGREIYGFANWDFRASSFLDGTCTVKTGLPAYQIRYLQTGQFVEEVVGNGEKRYAQLWRTRIDPPRFGQD